MQKKTNHYLDKAMIGVILALAWSCMIAHNLLLFGCFLITFLKKTWNPLEKGK